MNHPHLSPIEEPSTLFLRLVYGYSKRRFGKVLMVMKVIYSRVPRLVAIAQKIAATHENLSLEPELRFLVQVKVSQINGCAFCEDISLANALQKKIGVERFLNLPNYQSSTAFSLREQAALAFVEEATRHRKVSETTWKAVREQFDEQEIVELTWLNAAENYFNLQAAVLSIESDRLAENLKENQ